MNHLIPLTMEGELSVSEGSLHSHSIIIVIHTKNIPIVKRLLRDLPSADKDGVVAEWRHQGRLANRE